MTDMDAFEVLGFPRELTIDAEVVRARFQELSLVLHPDRGGNAADFRDLVEAAAILGTPARRWRHWAELQGWERGGRIVEMDDDVAAEFDRVGDLLGRARENVQARLAAGSAIARAMAGRKTLSLLAEISGKIAELSGKEEAILRRAKEGLDPAEAGKLSGELACLARWLRELREALASLAG